MNLIFSSSFIPLLTNTYRYLFLVGGRGSGKSEFAARKLWLRCEYEGNHRFVVLRKVRNTIKDSAWRVCKDLLEEQSIPYSENKTDLTLEFKSTRNKKKNVIQFLGFDDRKKIKSFKGCTGIWAEEMTAFSAQDFLDFDLILREDTGHYQQIMGTFNPDETEGAWIKEMFFPGSIPKTGPGKYPDSYIHHSTVADNPIKSIRDKYFEVLLRIKDPVYRAIYLAGMWAAPKGQIFNWDLQPLPKEMAWDQIFYGGDFGYSVDPAAAVKIYRRSHKYWLELILYETGLTDPAMAQVLKEDPRFDKEAPSYWDNSEPKAIRTLRDRGINAIPCTKTKGKKPTEIKRHSRGSVIVQLDQLKDFEIHIVENELSHHFEEEVRRYKMKQDKDGKIKHPLEPVDVFNHAISASRYGIFTNFDLYLREAWRAGRAHMGKPKEKQKEKEAADGKRAIITAAGRTLDPAVIENKAAPDQPVDKIKSGGKGHGYKRGRVHRG